MGPNLFGVISNDQKGTLPHIIAVTQFMIDNYSLVLANDSPYDPNLHGYEHSDRPTDSRRRARVPQQLTMSQETTSALPVTIKKMQEIIKETNKQDELLLQIQKLTNENANLKQQMDKKQSEATEPLFKQIEELKTQLHKEKRQRKTIQSQSMQDAQLLTQSGMIQKQLEFEKKLAGLQQTIDELEKKNEELTDALQVKEEKAEKVSNEKVVALEKQVSTLQNEKDTLKQQLLKNTESTELLQEDLRAKEQKLKQLTKDLETSKSLIEKEKTKGEQAKQEVEQKLTRANTVASTSQMTITKLEEEVKLIKQSGNKDEQKLKEQMLKSAKEFESKLAILEKESEKYRKLAESKDKVNQDKEYEIMKGDQKLRELVQSIQTALEVLNEFNTKQNQNREPTDFIEFIDRSNELIEVVIQDAGKAAQGKTGIMGTAFALLLTYANTTKHINNLSGQMVYMVDNKNKNFWRNQ